LENKAYVEQMKNQNSHIENNNRENKRREVRNIGRNE